jgi:hypothetical protein
MVKSPNRLLIFGAVAAAALVVPGLLGGPLGFQQADAAKDQRIDAVQTAEGVVAANVNANVGVDVSNNEVTACVIVKNC